MYWFLKLLYWFRWASSSIELLYSLTLCVVHRIALLAAFPLQETKPAFWNAQKDVWAHLVNFATFSCSTVRCFHCFFPYILRLQFACFQYVHNACLHFVIFWYILSVCRCTSAIRFHSCVDCFHFHSSEVPTQAKPRKKELLLNTSTGKKKKT